MKTTLFLSNCTLIFLLVASCVCFKCSCSNNQGITTEETSKPDDVFEEGTQPTYSIEDFKSALPESKYYQQTPTVLNISSTEEDLILRCASVDNAPLEAPRVPKISNLRALFSDSILIPVIFHVVHSSTGVGKVDSVVIENQVSLMNQIYGEVNIRFVHETRYIENNKYFNSGVNQSTYEEDDASIEMKKELREDPENTLNIYVTSCKNALGYATFPWDIDSSPESTMIDGVVIRYTSLPGESQTNYNEGKTVIHEIGHYLGLWHTFEGGCKGGDEVEDTPPQRSHTSGCPKERDSCPQHNGLDPIHNYMDYSFDTCMTEFTQGQINRMHWAVVTFRANFVNNSDIVNLELQPIADML
ncbi:MAG: zinc metalloprotease [Bacteroidota bacterium]